ncbi:MAG: dTMP kinase [Deltaproteobacteria bacterium]|jgi:dTMP kinase|nr:dTMP kinase [Deltaproteobacteria bacterium]MBW1854796.1 dTMP kinase [Deltaproteobacteria bacterium]MBW2183194.1 dTMP kinase [Deltaproteobacteria bacterium]
MKLFITFEGIEGCGKTTQISLLKEYLEQKGYSVVATREPGGTQIGDSMRTILLDSRNTHIDIKTELLLYEASRAQHIKDVVRPALDKGSIVLCDRFTDATLAYQGYAQRINKDLIERLNQFATDNITPDFTILIDCPVEIGLKRAKKRGATVNQKINEDRFEEKNISFHQNVRLGYLQIAECNSNRIHIVDGREDVSTVQQGIRTVVLKKIESLQPVIN